MTISVPDVLRQKCYVAKGSMHKFESLPSEGKDKLRGKILKWRGELSYWNIGNG